MRKKKCRGGTRVLRGFHVDNFCLPTQELKHLRLEFDHETRVLKTQDAIFPRCFAKITTNKIVKNLRPNGKKFSSSPLGILDFREGGILDLI